MEGVLAISYRHFYTACLKSRGVCGILHVAGVVELSLLRAVSQKMRSLVRSLAYEPQIAYQLFLYHTKQRCMHEIRNAILREPLNYTELEIKHDGVSCGLFQIAHEEVTFFNMNYRWVTWANKQWGVKHALSHAKSIAISSSCNCQAHYDLIHNTYTCKKDIQMLRFYVYQRLAQLANIPPV